MGIQRSDIESSDLDCSEEDVGDSDSVATSEDGERINIDRKLVFMSSQLKDPEFLLEHVFASMKLFKEAVSTHDVKIGRCLGFTKNDGRRIYARCKGEGCEWHINALKIKDQEAFQIRQINTYHSCARKYHVTNVNSSWLAKRFEKDFRTDPKKTPRVFKNFAMSKLGCYVSPF